jgi:hypothetical protein
MPAEPVADPARDASQSLSDRPPGRHGGRRLVRRPTGRLPGRAGLPGAGRRRPEPGDPGRPRRGRRKPAGRRSRLRYQRRSVAPASPATPGYPACRLCLRSTDETGGRRQRKFQDKGAFTTLLGKQVDVVHEVSRQVGVHGLFSENKLTWSTKFSRQVDVPRALLRKQVDSVNEVRHRRPTVSVDFPRPACVYPLRGERGTMQRMIRSAARRGDPVVGRR